MPFGPNAQEHLAALRKRFGSGPYSFEQYRLTTAELNAGVEPETEVRTEFPWTYSQSLRQVYDQVLRKWREGGCNGRAPESPDNLRPDQLAEWRAEAERVLQGRDAPEDG